MKASRALVVGAYGMLAGHIIPQLARRNIEISLAVYPGSVPHIPTPGLTHPALAEPLVARIADLDITNECALDELVRKVQPQLVINCAAYTAVDRAQTDYKQAFAVNAIGPRNVARAAKEVSAHFVHISSDYVFGGDQGERRTPWTEDDEPVPCGLYGESKRYGDELVGAIYPERSTIFRTSWLHGLYGPNFVETMIRLGETEPELRIVNDQTGSPTWAGWLAELILTSFDQELFGLYNACSDGNITWFDFASEIMRASGSKTRIIAQSSEELNRPAPRPAYSTLSTSKLQNVFRLQVPGWKESLNAHLEARKEK